MNNSIKKRYCKKCGCELSKSNKHKTCNACRRQMAQRIKHAMTSIAIFGGLGLGYFVHRKSRKQ